MVPVGLMETTGVTGGLPPVILGLVEETPAHRAGIGTHPTMEVIITPPKGWVHHLHLI
jgi:hypothetical protein